MPQSAADDDSIAAARERVQRAYDPQLMLRAGGRLAQLLAGHLDTVQNSRARVLNWAEPGANIVVAAQALERPPRPDEGLDGLERRFGELVELCLSRGVNLHDPRYVGHQVPASVPVAGLFDAVGSVTNQPMAIYEMGPFASSVEQAMLGELARLIGWQGHDHAGIVTHGASLANLTALLVARNVALPESWEQGASAMPGVPKLIVQADAHYCIARSAGMLGIGTGNVLKAELDDRRRMDPARLEKLLLETRRAGHPIIAVVACSCATPVGAFDPLEEIADVCARHSVWLHVDAAHGAAVLFSQKHRHLVAGISRADSLTWDAHKMLFVPALCAFLFYKNKRHSFEAFRQSAPYLFDPSVPGLAEFDSGLRTLECTKRAAALGLWGVWSLFGPGLFADLVDVTFDLGQRLYEKLRDADDFVALHQPDCNIVVFRHVPAALREAPPERLGKFQWQLRRAVIESGEFYLVPTTHDGVAALRCTLINPLTTETHLDALLDALRRYGRALVEA
jgi:L-2,4-diaminobutyrate decarboxylase